MKKLLALVAIVACLSSAHADISMPKKDTFYDKLGRGLANIVMSPTEIIDSHYQLLKTEGPTVAFFKGALVQGPSRMVMNIAHGTADVITAPFPLAPGESYRSLKMAPYDSMVVNEYPPADLHDWY